MDIKIIEINNIKELKKSIKFQYSLYKGNPFYVPPLLVNELKLMTKNNNPAMQFCEVKHWLAYNNNSIVGRITGIINHNYIKTWSKKQARFTNFDCINDKKVAFALFEFVEKWAKEKGMEALYGPYGYTNLEKHGLLVEGFNELATNSSNYNYPYYQEFIELYGFEKDTDWVERQIMVPEKLPDKITRLSDLLLQKNKLHFKELRHKKDILKYAGDLFNLYNTSYAGLYGMVALNDEQKETLIKQYYPVLDKDLLAVIYNDNEQMVAFGISLPSLSKALQKAKGSLFPFGFYHIRKALRKNDTLDLMLIAVHPDYQKKGINALLFNKIAPKIFERGFNYVETTQNLETNIDVQNQWRFYDTRLHKRSRSYIKKFA